MAQIAVTSSTSFCLEDFLNPTLGKGAVRTVFVIRIDVRTNEAEKFAALAIEKRTEQGSMQTSRKGREDVVANLLLADDRHSTCRGVGENDPAEAQCRLGRLIELEIKRLVVAETDSRDRDTIRGNDVSGEFPV